MPFSQQHFDMLSEMGIPMWVERSRTQAMAEPESLTKDNAEPSAQAQALPETRWLICVETSQLTTAEEQLLNAICKACHIPTKERALITEPQLSELPDFSHQTRRVLCLSPALWPTIQGAFASVEEAIIIADEMHLIASPSLSQMLSDARSKATLWSRIKHYVD